MNENENKMKTKWTKMNKNEKNEKNEVKWTKMNKNKQKLTQMNFFNWCKKQNT